MHPFDQQVPKLLDLGCGIGRHVIYAYHMGLDAYGIDLSSVAVKEAIEWAKSVGYQDAANKIIQSDVQNLPFPDQYFDFILSHAVLDSMSYEIAKNAIKESHRVLKKDMLFYCDLISGDDSNHSADFSGEELVLTEHEKETIQMYFNFSKIHDLIDGYFVIEEAFHVKRKSLVNDYYHSRYHLILKKI